MGLGLYRLQGHSFFLPLHLRFNNLLPLSPFPPPLFKPLTFSSRCIKQTLVVSRPTLILFVTNHESASYICALTSKGLVKVACCKKVGVMQLLVS